MRPTAAGHTVPIPTHHHATVVETARTAIASTAGSGDPCDMAGGTAGVHETRGEIHDRFDSS